MFNNNNIKRISSVSSYLQEAGIIYNTTITYRLDIQSIPKNGIPVTDKSYIANVVGNICYLYKIERGGGNLLYNLVDTLEIIKLDDYKNHFDNISNFLANNCQGVPISNSITRENIADYIKNMLEEGRRDINNNNNVESRPTNNNNQHIKRPLDKLNKLLIGEQFRDTRQRILNYIQENADKISFNETSSDGYKLLQTALKYNNNIEVISALIKYGADVNYINSYITPLSLAIKYNNIEAMQLLINNGADVNFQNRRSYTPLYEVVSSNEEISIDDRIRMVDILIRSGADVNIPDNSGVTPLSFLLKRGITSTEMVRLVDILLQPNFNINKTYNSGWTYLMSAINKVVNEEFTLPIIKKMINIGADVNIVRGGKGRTALYEALNNHNNVLCNRIIQILILEGAKVNDIIDASGESPLVMACFGLKNGTTNKDTIKILLEAGADAKYKDDEFDVLSIVAKNAPYDDRVFISNLLKMHGATLDITSYENAFSAFITNKENKPYDISLLSFYIENYNIVNKFMCCGMTPLLFAIKRMKYLDADLIDTLLYYGSDVDATDKFGKSALIILAERYSNVGGGSNIDDIINIMSKLESPNNIHYISKKGYNIVSILVGIISNNMRSNDLKKLIKMVEYYIQKDVNLRGADIRTINKYKVSRFSKLLDGICKSN